MFFRTTTGEPAGNVTRDGTPIAMTEAAGAFALDPLAGNDNVKVFGTLGVDTINAVLNPTAPVQVNALKTVQFPAANVELLSLLGDQGGDKFNVSAFSGTSMNLFIDGDFPSGHKKANDTLNLIAATKGAKLANKSGRVAYTGFATATYPSSIVRVDYLSVEVVKLLK